MAEDYAVIGLGRFGLAVAHRLSDGGADVLAVDRNVELVNEISNEVAAAVSIDATDEEALAELRPERFQCVIVAIGHEAMEASILTTALLAQRDVPRIVSRAVSQLHGRVLEAVGAHEVINPEWEMGAQVARRLLQPRLVDAFDFGESASIAELECPAALAGKTLIDSGLRKDHGLTVLAIRRNGEVDVNPESRYRLRADDVLVVIGEPGSVDEFGQLE